MDIYEIIKNRRSVRSFKKKPIKKAVLKKIMDAATWAPSALNSQNWKFYVLTGQSRDDFAKLLVPVFDQMESTIMSSYGPEAVEIRRKLYTNAGDAPVVIVVYVEEGAWDWDKTGSSMACQNILLAAKAEGIASLYMGAPRYVKDAVDKFLGEKKAKLLGAILLGYPNEDPKPKARFKDKVIWMK